MNGEILAKLKEQRKFTIMELREDGSLHNNQFEADRFSWRKTPAKPNAQPKR